MLRATTIALAALIACSGLAQAQPSEAVAGVRYGDLDLSTDAGARVMVDRLTRAAFQTCKHRLGTPAHRKCVAETVSKSVAALNTPQVTKQYLARR